MHISDNRNEQDLAINEQILFAIYSFHFRAC